MVRIRGPRVVLLPEVAKEMSAGARDRLGDTCEVLGICLAREAAPSVSCVTSLIERR